MKKVLEGFITVIEGGRKGGMPDTAILDSLLALLQVAVAIQPEDKEA